MSTLSVDILGYKKTDDHVIWHPLQST